MSIKPGIYKHYKGNLYRVHKVVKNSEDWNGSGMVLYEAIHDTPPEEKFIVRPAHMFTEMVEWEGKSVPRFVWVGENLDVITPPSPAEPDSMLKLLRLLSLLQITKQQPLTGYIAAGIKLSEIPTLAEHQYGAAMSAFLVCDTIVQRGGKIDTQKIVLMLLLHDLGELFGGDISGPLNRRFPELREYKDKIGERAVQLLTEFVSNLEREKIIALHHEFEKENTDEKWIAKILDQMDHQFFLEHHHYRQRLTAEKHDYRDTFVHDHIYQLAEKISDPAARAFFEEFFAIFKTDFDEQGFVGINELI